MSFGGQMGMPGQFNPGQDIFQDQLRRKELDRKRNPDVMSRFGQIQEAKAGQPGTLSQGFQGALGNLQNMPGQLAGGMAQSVQQSPEFQRMSADPQAYTQAYAPQRPPAQPPMEEPPMVPSQATPQAQPPQPVMQAAQQAGQTMGGFGEANKEALQTVKNPQITKDNSPLKRSMNERLTSEVPEDFADAVADFEKVKDEDLVEGTPQAFFKKQIDEQYLKGTDEKGNQIYECPLTKKPCGRKTFFQRLKEFFLHSIGKKSAEEVQKVIVKYDKQDPITKSVEPTQEDPGQVWKSPYRLKEQAQSDTGMSGYRGAM